MDYNKELSDFLQRKSKKKKLIVLYGPTAAGKTAMSINIAKRLNTEIISTDSRQIFKYMNIGTAKIRPEEMEGVPHHMIDLLDPSEEFSVGEYKRQAEEIMERLYGEDKIPMLVGGTGLYIDALIYDFNIPKIVADFELRQKLEKEAQEYGVEYIYNKLLEIDPEYAQEVHPNNVQYVIRAIEVKLLSGKSKGATKVPKKLNYDVLFLTPYEGNREKLYNRINYRVDLMFKQGLEDEMKKLIDMGYAKESFGMKSIGYTEYFEYLEGKYDFDEMKEKIKQNSRKYAKRQLTWFRKYNNSI